MRFPSWNNVFKGFNYKKKLGNIVNSTFYFGEYLPSMHKYEDYKKLIWLYMSKEVEPFCH